MTVLTFTAGLTGIFRILVNGVPYRLFVGDLRFAYVCLNFEFAQHSVYDDLKMKLAHARYDGLSRFFVGISFERRVFFGEFGKSDAHFFLARLCFRLDRYSYNRFREFHRFEDDGFIIYAERVARRGVFETDCGNYIARIRLFEVLSVVCVHKKNTSETFAAALCSVFNGLAGANFSRINSEKAELSYERVCHDLKREG